MRALVAVCAATGALGASSAAAGTTERVSVHSGGDQRNEDSGQSAISADGRYVAFVSGLDVFVRDRLTGTTEPVSVDRAGHPGNGVSSTPSISADGRYVAFVSAASNLVAGDTNLAEDVFVRDRVTGATERVGVKSAGGHGRANGGTGISADGRYVAFVSAASTLVPNDTNGELDVFVHDRATGATERVSIDSRGGQANRASVLPSLSADGRYVAFGSDATNLVPGDTNGTRDVFVHDRATGATERVSVDSAGHQGNDFSGGPAVSADGRYVAFGSWAALVEDDTNRAWDIFVRDRLTGTTERVSVNSAGRQSPNAIGGPESRGPSISADGRYVAFASYATTLLPRDTNGAVDVFVRDRVTGTTERVSVSSTGVEGNFGGSWPGISADGRWVAFVSFSSNLVPADTNGVFDVFVHDRARATRRVSVGRRGEQANRPSFSPSLSAGGRYVAFVSHATNLVPGDTNGTRDVFVHDRATGATERVSADSAGNQGNDFSGGPTVSASGRYVAFVSAASNLVRGDSNLATDIFVRDRLTGTTARVSVDGAGGQGNFGSVHPSISADGRYVAFVSFSSNLVPKDTNGELDVFVHDRATGATERVSVGRRGEQANRPSVSPSISGDGRYVAFVSHATNLVPGDTNGTRDVFVHDRITRATERVSVDQAGGQGHADSDDPSISADGRYVAFRASGALVRDDTNGEPDIFVRDRLTGTTERVSLDRAGGQVAGSSGDPSISADGRYVAFRTRASMVPDDTNGAYDVYVRDRLTGTTERVSVDGAGGQGSLGSGQPSISADGRAVAFVSSSPTLIPADTNGGDGVFVRSLNY